MISGYVNMLDVDEASKLFYEMPNPDIFSWNKMIAGHAQIGDLDSVNELFGRMPQKNLVSWNSVITGYEKNDDYIGAIKIFIQMQIEGEKPDRHTLSSVLSVSTGIVDLQLGMQIHQLALRQTKNRNWKFKLFTRKGGFPRMEKASCELTGGCLLQSLKNREDHFEHTVNMVKK
ncbi:hypothetical protein OIU78_008802 [Salix suchowensis]|nr:hypothetical protein OIU78_008802 [Salix suchowensis]